MRSSDTSRASSPARNAKRECCTDAPCGSGLRNQYFEGKRLTVDAFRVEQSYLIERRRLLNRAIHGWGVVYGYALKPAPGPGAETRPSRLEIGPGLALDECGRELLSVRAVMIDAADVILLDGKGGRLERPPAGSLEPREGPKQEVQQTPACWLLSAHYAEQSEGPVRVNDPCSCERNEWDRLCETVRFSLRLVDYAECCRPFDCELQCECGTGPCCEQRSKEHADQEVEQTEDRKTKAHPVDRGGCQCLCDHLTGLSDTECCALCEIEEPCAHIRADLRHGVPLACVRLREGDCDKWEFDCWVEACGPRRLVKRNDALFDLIRGCDLTRISAIGWADWHRSRRLVEWEDFAASLGSVEDSERDRKGKQRRKRSPVETVRYWVEFSRPVRKQTVRADCFAMTVLVEQREGGWSEVYRVPILDVHTSAPADTAAGLVTRATLVVDAGWLRDAVYGDKTIFDEDPTAVEIEIRGDFIVDCNGQTVDANAHGLTPAPTGNGTPGGTFVSSFHVQPRYAEYRIPDESADSAQGAEP
jgi:hypothetical protein